MFVEKVSAIILAMFMITGSVILFQGIHDEEIELTVKGAKSYVGGPGNSIQMAINNASAGDTVIIGNGTYNQTVIVNKTITLMGNSTENVIINGTGTGDVITVNVDWANVTHLTARNAGSGSSDAGVRVVSSNYVRVEYVNASDNGHNGIQLYCSDHCRVLNCTANSNGDDGIHMMHNYPNDFPDSNEVAYNHLEDNDDCGIQIANAGTYGANWLHHNRIVDNSQDPGGVSGGILLWGGYSKNNIIEHNFIHGNLDGLHYRASGITNNIARWNTVINSTNFGIHYTNGAGANYHYQNNFINSGTAHTSGLLGSDILDLGRPMCGNYWDDYTGSDSDGDDIGDTSYSAGSAADNYPWMSRDGWFRVRINETDKWHTTIQWAVDNATAGQNIWIPDGKYYEHVEINKKLNVTGESWDGVSVDGEDTGDPITITSNMVNITNIGVTGGMDANIFLTGRNCNIKHVQGHDGEVGIHGRGCYGTNIMECWMHNNSFQGIYLEMSSNNNTIRNSTVENNGLYGIVIAHRSHYNVVDNCRLTENNARQIYLAIGPENCRISNNMISGTDDGIVIGGCGNNLVSDNRIKTSHSAAIEMSLTYNNTLENNLIHSHYGIDISQDKRSRICSNTLEGGSNGIDIAYSSNGTIRGNKMANHTDYGIFLNVGEDHVIENNTLTSMDNEGIKTYRMDMCSIEGNIISRTDSAIYLEESNRSILEENRINRSRETGIYLDKSHGNTVEQNSLDDDYYGIILEGSNGTEIINNLIRNVRLSGLLLDDANSNEITGNEVIGCPTGMAFSGGINDHNNIIGNSFMGGDVGIWFFTGNDNLIRDNTFKKCEDHAMDMYPGTSNMIYHNNFIANNGGSVQARDLGNNTWNMPWPEGGNYWSDYNGNDYLSGVNQDYPGGDGLGDTPYYLDTGGMDRYPLISQSGSEPMGDILIVSHEDGEPVSGTELVEVAVTSPSVQVVKFYINGIQVGIDATNDYQFIFDTTAYAEDQWINFTAEAQFSFVSPIRTTIHLWINNEVDEGSYISVETSNDTYHPDQTGTVSIITMNGPPKFHSARIQLVVQDPVGKVYFVSNETYPHSARWELTFPVTSDAEEGEWGINATVWGLMMDEIIWRSHSLSSFMVQGENIHSDLEDLDESIDNASLEINGTLNDIMDRLKDIQNDQSYLNHTITQMMGEMLSNQYDMLQELTDLGTRIRDAESNLTSRIDGLNASMRSRLAENLQTIEGRLDIVDDALGGMDTKLDDMSTSFKERMDVLEDNLTDNITALRDYLELCCERMEAYMEVINSTIHDHLDMLEEEIENQIQNVISSLGDVQLYIQGMNRTSIEDREQILDAMEAMDGLVRELNNQTMDEIGSGLSQLHSALAGINDTEAQRHADTVAGILAGMDSVNSSIEQHLDEIDAALAQLENLTQIVEELDQVNEKMATTEDVDSGTGHNTTLLYVIIIFCVIIMMILVFLLVRRTREEQRDNPSKEKAPIPAPPSDRREKNASANDDREKTQKEDIEEFEELEEID